MDMKFSFNMGLRTKFCKGLCRILLEMAPLRYRGFQYEVGVAKRIGKFCPSDSVRPTDRLHTLNVFTCHVINHFKQKVASKCNLEELSDA